ncbi:MAG: Maf family protein, partial [Rhodospirillales bacterium]|nr:Maf family protein [Rhodospirillales bacterium]
MPASNSPASRSEGRASRLILASASPRRLELLAQIGITPNLVQPSKIKEIIRPRELPIAAARRLAEAKAWDVSREFSGDFVLGADTIVACGRRILGKAQSETEARRFLSLLSGRRHKVFGGVSVIDPDGKSHTRVVTTSVAVKRLSEREISDYIDGGEWRDKAGAYAIQGKAAVFIRQIIGSYSNVVGLPLFETAALLHGLGY